MDQPSAYETPERATLAASVDAYAKAQERAQQAARRVRRAVEAVARALRGPRPRTQPAGAPC